MKEYIDRQAVREILYNHYSRDVYTHEGIVHKVTAEIDVDELNSIPVADVRENGEAELLPCETGYYECSRCHHRIMWEASKIENIKFCWNCGVSLRSK